MFWKNTAWSWDDAAGSDGDDDGGHLLAADLRKTPEPAPDPNLKPSAAASAATAGPKDLTNRRWTCGFSQNLDSINANYGSHASTPSAHSDQQQETRTNSSQQRGVSRMTQTQRWL